MKQRRSQEISDLFRKQAFEYNSSLINTEQLILIEGFSRKSREILFGRNESNIKVLVPIKDLEDRTVCTGDYRRFDVGDYIVASIMSATSQTLHGQPRYITTLDAFYSSLKNEQIKSVSSKV